MRKEVIIAIVIGSLIGIFGAYVSLGQRTPQTEPTITTSPTALDTPTPQAKSITFEVTTPLATSVASETPITVTGMGHPEASVVLDTPLSPVFAERTDSTFTAKMALEEGVNPVTVLEIDQEVKAITRDILYVPGSKDLLVKSGSITDITEGGIQIRQDNGEVSTVKTSNATKYKNDSKTVKEIKATEVAIGDTIFLAGHMVDKIYFADYVYVTTLAAKRGAPVKGTVTKSTSKEVIVSVDGKDQAYTLANYQVYSLTKTNLTKVKAPVTGRGVIILASSILVLEARD